MLALRGAGVRSLSCRYPIIKRVSVQCRVYCAEQTGPKQFLDDDEEVLLEKTIKADKSLFVPYSSL